MTTRTTDTAVLEHITALIAEEERLHGIGADKDRIAVLEIELDQYWDLLRRRRALREFGRNPDAADIRAASMVEKYEG